MTGAAGRIESVLARLEALPDGPAREAAREAVTAVVELHREAVRRLSSRVGEETLRAAAEDDLVAALLSLHGVHPVPVEERVRRALARVRAARVEILAIDRGVIRLRADGDERLRRAAARAVEDAAPEIERVEVAAPDPALVPIERLTRAAHQRCELCRQELGPEHPHLFDVERRQLSCACAACGVLFDSSARPLRRVRRHARRLRDLRITDAQWQALQVPVGLAFFSRSTALGAVVAAYPGPAGAVESEVPGQAWEALVRGNPALAAIEPDTAALLVHRQRPAPRYYVVSIDECYRLTGLVRSRWQAGGPAAAIEEFFGALAEDRP